MNCARPLDPIFSIMQKGPGKCGGRRKDRHARCLWWVRSARGFNIHRLTRASRFGPQLGRALVHAPPRSD
jgi:hypothetical protein